MFSLCHLLSMIFHGSWVEFMLLGMSSQVGGWVGWGVWGGWGGGKVSTAATALFSIKQHQNDFYISVIQIDKSDFLVTSLFQIYWIDWSIPACLYIFVL
jgi:hypothetical protein